MRYEYDFEEYMLAELGRFKTSRAVFIITDLIKKQLEIGLETQSLKFEKEIQKATKDKRSSAIANQLLAHLKNKENSIDKINKFIEKTGAKVIEIDKATSLRTSISYLNSSPRYANGYSDIPPLLKGDFGFSDVLNLSAVDQWAIQNGHEVLAISYNKKWNELCRYFYRIDSSEDISSAKEYFYLTDPSTAIHLSTHHLEKLTSNSKDYCGTYLYSKIREEIKKRISSAFYRAEQCIDGITADPNSRLEYSSCESHFMDFSFINGAFSIKEYEFSYFVVEFEISVTLKIEASFDIYANEDDYIKTIRRKKTEDFTTFIRVKFCEIPGSKFYGINKGYDSFKSLYIEDLHVTNTCFDVDFGELHLKHYD